MIKKGLLLLLLLSTIFVACNSNEGGPKLSKDEEKQIAQMAASYFKPLPEIDWKNYTAQQKSQLILGKKLFFDKKLSKKQSQNCASCHIMEKFGQDNLRVSPGDAGELGLRNVPTIMNASLQYAQLWDAREKSVEDQAALPIFGDKEMGMTDTLELELRLQNDPLYPELFSSAFPSDTSPVNLENLKTAIGAFERTLYTPARFDDYLHGDHKAMSRDEKLGMKVFIDRGCIPCHSGVLLGGNMAQKFALFGYYWDYTNSPHLDKGIYEQSLNPSDKFMFKVPTLRNVAETAPYFHDGSVYSLEESIRIMSLAEMNIELEENDVQLIARFFESLTGAVPDYAIEDNKFPFE